MDLQSAAAIATIIGLAIAVGAWLRPRSAPGTTSPPAASPPVSPTPGLIVTSGLAIMGTSPTTTQTHIYVTAVNPLPRMFQIVAVGMQLKDKGLTLTWVPPIVGSSLPCKLAEAEKASYYSPPRKIALALIGSELKEKLEVRGYVRDTFGTEHVSSWMEFEPQKWLNKE